jgi:hypothetical protein
MPLESSIQYQGSSIILGTPSALTRLRDAGLVLAGECAPLAFSVVIHEVHPIVAPSIRKPYAGSSTIVTGLRERARYRHQSLLRDLQPRRFLAMSTRLLYPGPSLRPTHDGPWDKPHYLLL